MEIKFISAIAASILITSCSSNAIKIENIKDVYVTDFHSDDARSCKTSDVDLGHREAYIFFNRAKKVTLKILHDHYNYAPCYIEGTLKHNSTPCEWEIRAGATGFIQCEDITQYFACDNCDDLFSQQN